MNEILHEWKEFNLFGKSVRGNVKSEARNPRLLNNLFGGQAKFETSTNVRNLNVPNE